MNKEITKSTAAASSPSFIGPYRLLGLAGRGGMAAVYEAVDDRIDRTVALKLLSPTPQARPEEFAALVGRMQREARAIARLSHPNIALVLDVGTTRDGVSVDTASHYIVMEFLRGESLRSRLDRTGPLTPAQAAHVLEQAAAGLDAVHDAGVVHRDIKPSNLMLLPDETVKLTDFGVARFTDDTTVTRTGMMVGSPAYMAPELLQGQTATSASDIWSLGVVLYEMLTGKPPFAGENIAAVMYKILHAEPDLTAVSASSAAARTVVKNALERDPGLRYARATDMARAFREAIEGRSGMRRQVLPPQRTPPKPWLPVLVGGMALAGAAFFLLRPHHEPGAGKGVKHTLTSSAKAPQVVKSVRQAATAPSKRVPPLLGPPPAVKRAEVKSLPMPPSKMPVATTSPVSPLFAPPATAAGKTVRIMAAAVRPAPKVAVVATVGASELPAVSPTIAAPSALPEHPVAAESPGSLPGKTEAEGDLRSLTGIWHGTHSGQPALLIINPQEADGRWNGTMTVHTPTGDVLIAVSGRLDGEGTFSFTEDRVIEANAERAWDLGQNSGSVDSATGDIEGKGRDARGRHYAFVFRRR